MRPPVILALVDDIEPGLFTLETDVCLIGRDETCQIVVPGEVISRQHAAIERNGSLFFIHNVSTTNRTYVNQQIVQEKFLLKDQDEIGLSNPQAMLRFEDFEATTPVLLPLRYDEKIMRFFLNKVLVDLTPNELRLLHYLYLNSNAVCRKENCAEMVWEREYDPGPDDEGLEKLVSRIRRKLGDIDPEGKKLLETRRGIGYLLNL